MAMAFMHVVYLHADCVVHFGLEPPHDGSPAHAIGGAPNSIPVGERGWTFLERFITMLKVAMRADADAALASVLVTDSDVVRDEVRDGARRIREAVAAGDLAGALSHFRDVLRTKRFVIDFSASWTRSESTPKCSGPSAAAGSVRSAPTSKTWLQKSPGRPIRQWCSWPTTTQYHMLRVQQMTAPVW